MSMKKKVSGAFGVIVLAVALVVLANSAFIIRENQYGLVRQFGRIERVISDSGLYFKVPFIQEKDTVSKELLLYDIAKSDVITQDKKSMIVDSFVL